MREKWNAFNADLSNPKMHQKAGPIVIKNKVSAEVVHMAAAAPDLLEALEALEACANAMYADNPADGWKEILDDARAAISKAYGESE